MKRVGLIAREGCKSRERLAYNIRWLDNFRWREAWNINTFFYWTFEVTWSTYLQSIAFWSIATKPERASTDRLKTESVGIGVALVFVKGLTPLSDLFINERDVMFIESNCFSRWHISKKIFSILIVLIVLKINILRVEVSGLPLSDPPFSTTLFRLAMLEYSGSNWSWDHFQEPFAPPSTRHTAETDLL